MKWERVYGDDHDSPGWLEVKSPVGEWAVCENRGQFWAIWYPLNADVIECVIGRYRTEGAAKGACKRYAKRMAAAFKAMGKAGWQ